VSVTKMLAQDPTKWPDVNPLTKGPRYALTTFPDSVYGTTAASSAGASSAPKPADDGPQRRAGDPGSAGPGLPGWLWPLAALLVLGAVGLAFLRRHTGRRTSAPSDTTKEV
jgi:hypothetical protein